MAVDRRVQRRGLGMLLLAVAGSTAVARADFQPPKDGKLTEKQVTAFIAIQKEQMDAIRSAQNATAGGNAGGAASLALMAQMGKKMDAAVAKHGLTKEEFSWVSEQVGQLWPLATLQQNWDDAGKPDLEKQLKLKTDELAAAQAKQAQYEQAQKDGKRVLSAEQRESALSSAKSDRESAAGELKSAQESLDAAKAEAAGHDKDAATADGLAQTPPADVSADDKPTYVEAHKQEAQSARDAAKETRARLPDAEKSVADAKAKIAALDGKLAHPEVPTTDDERAQVKQENDQAIADAKQTVDGDQQALGMLKETLAAGAPIPTDPKPDADNLAVVKKHIKEYWAAVGLPDPSAKK